MTRNRPRKKLASLRSRIQDRTQIPNATIRTRASYIPAAVIRNTTRSRSSGSNRPQVVAEDIQRVQLKTDHYASHCQIELARRRLGQWAGPSDFSKGSRFSDNCARGLSASESAAQRC